MLALMRVLVLACGQGPFGAALGGMALSLARTFLLLLLLVCQVDVSRFDGFQNIKVIVVGAAIL